MRKRLGFAQFDAEVLPKGTVALCLALCGLGLVLSANAQQAKFIEFDVPGACHPSVGCSTADFPPVNPSAINPEGAVTGSYASKQTAVCFTASCEQATARSPCSMRAPHALARIPSSCAPGPPASTLRARSQDSSVTTSPVMASCGYPTEPSPRLIPRAPSILTPRVSTRGGR